MSQPKHSWTRTLIVTVASCFLPHVAFASVGAGSGLPYEDTFSKIVTSLTGPWAWTVAIVCVIIFAWKSVERGGDLGGSTMTFLGPAFICTLLLGAKKLMTFFGQGAILEPDDSVCWTPFVCGVVFGMLMFASVITLPLYRRHQQLLQQRLQLPSAVQQHAVES